MKTKLTAAAALCLLLLAACAVAVPAAEETVPPVYEVPDYRLGEMTARESFAGDSGEVFADYSYQLPSLSLENADALSPQDLQRAEGAVATFNARMEELLDASVASGREMGQMARDAHAAGSAAPPYFDRTTTTVHRQGEILSVRMDNESYRGGAHSGQVTSGYLFDLVSGQFLDPAQLSDRQEEFVQSVAQLLTKAAEGREENAQSQYWPDYKDIIARWNQGAVTLDAGGMTVIYSPYELGPHALGTVELHLTYDQLSPLLGEGGRGRLDLTESA